MQNQLETQLFKAITESLQCYLISNAVFLAERLYYENKSHENLALLCECYLTNNKPYKVYSLLKASTCIKNKYLYGVACLRLNKISEAEVSFKKCLDSELNISYASYMLGYCYEKQQNHREATTYYLKALEKNPTLWVAYERLCHIGNFLAPDKIFKEKIDVISKQSINFFNYTDKMNAGKQSLNVRSNATISDTNKCNSYRKNTGTTGFTNGFDKFNINSNTFNQDSKNLNNDNNNNSNNVFDKKFNINAYNDGVKYESDSKMNEICSFLKIFASPYCFLMRFQIREALILFKKLPSNQYLSGWVLLQIAKCYMELRDYISAEEYFTKALEIEPYNIECMGYYSSCLWQLKKHTNLAHLSHNALEQTKLESDSWLTIGNCYSLENEHENALKFFNRAIQLKSDSSYVHCLCGHEYIYLDDYFNAKKYFEISLSLNKRNYNAWWGLGDICFKQEKYEKAIEHFQRAIHINPKSSILYTFLGMSLNCQKVYGEAVKNFDYAIFLDDKNYLSMFQKANALFQLEHYDMALNELEKLHMILPTETSVVIMIARIYAKLGVINKANNYMSMALDLEPHASQKIKESVGLGDPVMFLN